MYVKQELSFEYLLKNCWGEAKRTIEEIIKNYKTEELMDLLEEIFGDKIPTITEINDFLWFEDDTIFNYLDIEVDY